MNAARPRVIAHMLKDDGTFPNNRTLPFLCYKSSLNLEGEDPAAATEKVFEQNGWNNCWRDGIYDYHHYHSTAHEVLGIYSGNARVQVGGPTGITLDIEKGDVLIIPAGVAHKNLGSSPDFKCVGAYPAGQVYDMNYGKGSERPLADRNISLVYLPQSDPVFGEKGYLKQYWRPLLKGMMSQSM